VAPLTPISQAPELLEQLMPENPQDGDVIKMPDGYSCGESNIIRVFKNENRIGIVSGLRRVENVSNIYVSDRMTVIENLKPGDVIRIVNARYLYVSLQFVEYLGWMGRDTHPRWISTHDAYYEVVEMLTIDSGSAMTVYEQTCLKHVQKEKKNG